MIRHTNSLILSIIVHILFAVLFFAGYRYVAFEEGEKEKSATLNLCCINRQLPPKELPKPEPKKIHKPEKKPVQEPKPKPKAKPKHPTKKKTVEVQKAKKIVKEKKEIKPEPVKEKVEEETPKEEIQEEHIEPEVPKQNIVNKSVSTAEVYIKKNIQKIAKLLSENLYYPRSARKRGITGKILIKFTLQKDASVSDIIVLDSNSEVLSRAAIKTIQDLSKKFPKPNEVLTLSVPIDYKLH